jgi:2'-5' RNA ligase
MEPATRPLELEPKVALTAAVLIPAEAVWEPIQAIRRRYDPQVRRWMPHVTLLYPFVPEGRLEEAVERLRRAGASIAAFEVTLADFGHFVHERGSVTLWLRPEPAERVAALQRALQGAMPWCDDVSRFAGGFAPHLSVGRFRGRVEAEQVAAELKAGWQPVRCAAADVALIARSGRPEEPFSVRLRLPLGPV